MKGGGRRRGPLASCVVLAYIRRDDSMPDFRCATERRRDIDIREFHVRVPLEFASDCICIPCLYVRRGE